MRWRQWGRAPWLRWLLRQLANQAWMPTIESKYVIDRLEHRREQAWRIYERERYGAVVEASAEGEAAYPELLQRASATGAWPLLALPPELDPERQKPLRLQWLQMTEALAECHLFSNPSTRYHHWRAQSRPRHCQERQAKSVQIPRMFRLRARS